MRPSLLFAAVVAAASPVLAQSSVSTAVPRRPAQSDSMRVMVMRRPLSPVEVRKLAADLQVLIEQVKRTEREMTIVAERGNTVPTDGARRMYVELFQKQSELAFACADLRRPGGYLGVQFADTATVRIRAGIEAEIERFNRVPVIGEVSPGSPAEKAGVRRGDAWVAVDGVNLVGMDVDHLFATLKPGARLELRLRRDGRDVEVPALIEKLYPDDVCESYPDVNVFTFRIDSPDRKVIMRPTLPVPARGAVVPRVEPGFGGQVFVAGYMSINGATFRALTTEKREVLKAPAEAGVLVDAVDAESPASVAGLREWDVVLRVNGERVGGVQDLIRALNARQPLVLTVFKGGETRTVTLTR